MWGQRALDRALCLVDSALRGRAVSVCVSMGGKEGCAMQDARAYIVAE